MSSWSGEDHISRRIRGLNRQHQNLLQELLQDYEMYPGQPPLMFSLDREPGRSQNELAKELNIQKATLTVMLNRMEKTGLVRRESDARDQRISRIYLTDKGKGLLARLQRTLDVLEEQAMKGFSEEEKQAMSGMLARIEKNLKELKEAKE
ncbi:MarR family winged helix-turn-helix transcriptional regulator [Paenibacillus sp. CAU 1782]